MDKERTLEALRRAFEAHGETCLFEEPDGAHLHLARSHEDSVSAWLRRGRTGGYALCLVGAAPRPLDEAQARVLLATLWDGAGEPDPQAGKPWCLDVETWHLAINVDGVTRAVTRCAPRPGAFTRAAEALLHAARAGLVVA